MMDCMFTPAGSHLEGSLNRLVTPMMRSLLVGLVLLAPSSALEMPSCEDDTAAHCLGDDADMSSEGIDACLAALTDRSQRCTDYLKMLEACKADISGDGVCASAHGDGETMPCLLQRTKPEALSESCRATLPKDDAKGLAKFWADGKRQLNINEIADLNADDKDTYNRWKAKKAKKGKTDKDKERDYAVKAAKRERVIDLISSAVKEAVAAASEPDVKMAIEVAKAEAQKALDEDMTGTLKAFGKTELENMARDAYKAAVKAKKTEL